MSLQGSLDAFALPDVLALLASTKKSGELRVSGERSEGRIWFDEGQVVGAEAPRAHTPADVFFELLRQVEGSFVFDAESSGAEGEPMALEPLLAEAQSRLAEWRAIEKVVPSLGVRVRMASTLPGPEVTLRAEQWRVLAVVAGGCTVETVAETLELGEFDACDLVKGLVEDGLAEVEEEMEEEGQGGPVPEPRDLDSLVEIPKRRKRPLSADRRPSDDGSAAAPEEPATEGDLDVPAAVAALSPEKARELAQELADLGTEPEEAVDAVEAAARAATPEERAEALKGVLTDEHGEPINRGLLLKFLSSVRS